MSLENRNIRAFFALVRAGLWEQDVQLAPYGEIDFAKVLRLSEEQSVVGLVAAGIEHIVDRKPQKKDVLQFIGRTVHMERRNQTMNCFIGNIVEKMRAAGIYTVLVKGQGVGQCYSRPLWRGCRPVLRCGELREGKGVPDSACVSGGAGRPAQKTPGDDY